MRVPRAYSKADTHSIQEPANVEVNFLHRTVRGYLERADIWQKMCATTPSLFSCHVRLCNCFIVRLKRQDQLSDSFLDWCQAIINGTENAIRETKNDVVFRAKLLVSLDEVYADLMNAATFESSTPALVDFVNGLGTDLINVAVRCDMYGYPVNIFQSWPRDLQSRVKSHCLFLAVNIKYEDNPLRDEPSIRAEASPRSVHFLLESGADLNLIVPEFEINDARHLMREYSTGSAWNQLLERATDYSDECDERRDGNLRHSRGVCSFFGTDLGSRVLTQYLRETANDASERVDKAEEREVLETNEPLLLLALQ
ncbi:hypothetical protein ST47_g5148 [Ascochyta rabiei]|uniref:DUF7791 domain-containing protein n=1 Tax=Didymella rabiei TaxID=5454 RepID=A0A163EF96_DIDRA|nr:hypothetical protein ST47_g5148 [Ascochyta rabiei]